MQRDEIDSPQIIDAIECCGYRRTGRRRFLANWSTKLVKQKLLLNVGRVPVLTLGHSISNKEVFDFSARALHKFGGNIYKNSRPQKYSLEKGYMQFSLLEDHGKWPLSIYLPDATVDTLAATLERKIKTELSIEARAITNIQNLYLALVADVEPFSWARVHGGLRAAQVAALGCRLGLSEKEIISAVAPMQKYISSGISREIDGRPLQFVKDCVRYWHREDDFQQ